MNEMTTPGIGHNSDPFLDTKARVDALVENANRWLQERPKIIDDEMAGKCSDFIEQLTKTAKTVDTARLEANKPLREAIAENDKQYKPLVELLDTAKRLLKTRLTPWLQKKEQERIEAQRKAEEKALEALRAAEEAAKKAEQATSVQDVVAAEEAAKKAEQAVKGADSISKTRAHVQGDHGSRARGLRTVWSAVITNYDKALNEYRNDPQVRALIQRLADADARNPERRKLDIPGVEFQEKKVAA